MKIFTSFKAYFTGKHSIVCFILLLCLCSNELQAQTFTENVWEGDVSDEWLEPRNWSEGVVPNKDHNVNIGKQSTPTRVCLKNKV